jgi:bifunctional non-homologous end joining protein LigD
MTRRSGSTLPPIRPQLATLSAIAPAGDVWVHEIKYDGYRILGYLDGDRVRLVTRNGKDWTDRFPELVAALGRLRTRAIVDGEVAVELANGVTSFQALQNALRDPGRGALNFNVFDLLHLDDTDLRGEPLLDRKARLRALLEPLAGTPVRFSDHVIGHGEAFHRQACSHGLEGIISKRAGAPYREGRGNDWLKVKCVREQEFVVGGFTEPSGSRAGLGALHVGTWENARLVYRGKVGTGFSDAVLLDLRRRLQKRRRDSSPFANGPRRARGTHWVEPEMVVQVRFTDVTDDGRLRHPAYQGVREDKDAREVVMEDEAAAAGPKRNRSEALQTAAGGGSGGRRRGRGERGVGDPTSVAGVRLTSPGKVLYPEQGVTKLDLAQHYERVADLMLPHITGRPLTLVRCPSGRTGQCFFQKHMDESAPASIRRVQVEERDGPEWYGTLSSLAGLIALVQLGALELHTSNARADRLDRPDRFLIDLDPDEGIEWDEIVDTAFHIRDLLQELGLVSFLKTTGGKGLHVVVPLQRRAGWDEVKAFSRAVCALLAEAAPDRYTLDLSKRKRRGRILLDYLRNSEGATAIEAYSTRARAGATVAVPIDWRELEAGARPDSFTVENLPVRLARLKRDPWNDFGAVRQSLTAPMKRKLGLR